MFALALRSALLLSALLLAACTQHRGGPAGFVGATSSGSTSEVPARRAPLELEHAESYETTASKRGLRGDAANAELAKALAGASKGAHLNADGHLAELALGVAGASDRAQHAPSYALIAFHAQRAGIAEPTPELWLTSGPNVGALLLDVARAIREATQQNKQLTHLGAAAIYVDPTQPQEGVVIALALSSRKLSLRSNVPRSVPVGSTIKLQGELAAGYSDPVLALSGEREVTRHALGKGRRFQRDIPATQAGELTLELLANGPQGLAVVALMPVMVGSTPSDEPPPYYAHASEADADEVEQRLLMLIGEERARRKLAPLTRDARLTKIALAHSQDMAKHGFVAHSSERTGDASARVQSAGLKAELVMENIGRGYSADELHHGLMASPGHRANILQADAHELGIGVVALREGDRDVFLVTELFTRLAP